MQSSGSSESYIMITRWPLVPGVKSLTIDLVADMSS